MLRQYIDYNILDDSHKTKLPDDSNIPTSPSPIAGLKALKTGGELLSGTRQSKHKDLQRTFVKRLRTSYNLIAVI
jgi:hypothetical protein